MKKMIWRANRRFQEITGDIIQKSEAPAVGHHFRHRLQPYFMNDFRMEAAVEKRWSVTVSDLQAWTYTILDCLYCIVSSTSWLTRSRSLRVEDRIQNQK